jgi:L-alanine-DL-glutamate epimerase-like enolase superfamily enzyme
VSLPDTTIASIETWACSLPLDSPLRFGTFTVSHREYAIVRIETRGGLRAECVGLSRGMPVDVAIADTYAPLLLGTEAMDVAARSRDRSSTLATIELSGVQAMAWSLIDICLWDIRAQALGTPLWRLLGGDPRELRVLLVEGYALPDEDDERFALRLAARVEEGYRALKIEGASERDPARLRRRLELVRSAVGEDVDLVVDLAWKYPNAEAAAREIATWEHVRPAWIEDPFPRDHMGEYARLRGLVSAPIGAGDEVTREAALIDLVAEGAVDVVRLDATTIGGVSAAARVVASAGSAGRTVSTHAHPEVHLQCMLAWSAGDYVEAFPLDRSFDPEHRLHEAPFLARVHGGTAPIPDAPGTGVRLDGTQVGRHAHRHSSLPGPR